MDPDVEIPRAVTPKPRTFTRQDFEYRSITPEPIIKNSTLVATIGGSTNLGDLKYVDQNALDRYNRIGRFA